ncbi:hypothetical protein LJ655_19685 [Paraburkholderia sp. MMS20-SJTN17]|uniref:Uncharacterized protein n=1 Tax=Paraburkholderia translucens TaxID=2886945 RepID=A0ABS8KH56_9BURK|nr:hypothetical protein [Paraburkholderia sp. MMS20-SJTN17]MCC8404075.1 hypothetical protein [Paraburkholderia sp. MMS20-SJTN17]
MNPDRRRYEHPPYYELEKPAEAADTVGAYRPVHPYADMTKEEVEAAMGLYGLFNVRKVRDMH